MRYLLIVLFVVALLAPIYLSKTSHQLSNSPKTSQTTPQNSLKNLTVNGQTYAYDFFRIDQTDTYQVTLNLPEKISSTTFIKDNQCRYLINGGFYQTDFTPIGLLKINEELISNAQNNQLFNGYLSASQGANFIIQDHPAITSINAIQSGPILIDQKLPKKLSIQNNQSKRRMVAASDNVSTYFIVIVRPDSLFEGTPLEDLPSVTSEIGKRENVDIVTAINLDGGSASTFYNGQTHIKEVKPVGTFLCFK